LFSTKATIKENQQSLQNQRKTSGASSQDQLTTGTNIRKQFAEIDLDFSKLARQMMVTDRVEVKMTCSITKSSQTLYQLKMPNIWC
jgi:hypothetical protein